MKTEDVALARLRSDLLDSLWLKYPQALSLDQLEADVRVAYLTRETAWLTGAIREQLAVLNHVRTRQAQHQGAHVDRGREAGPPTGSPVPWAHQQPTHTTGGSMKYHPGLRPCDFDLAVWSADELTAAQVPLAARTRPTWGRHAQRPDTWRLTPRPC
jgi:hypothetical protein